MSIYKVMVWAGDEKRGIRATFYLSATSKSDAFQKVLDSDAGNASLLDDTSARVVITELPNAWIL